MASHHIIIKDDKGEPREFPLKTWVRQHLNELPEGIDPDSQTSHDVRRQLKNFGWQLQITRSEVFVIKPDENGSFDYAAEYISDIQEEATAETIETEEALEMTFSLEKDLQLALRKNIQTLEKGLTIIDNGKERNTIAGRIDITARDNENRIVIIELKAIDAKADVIAQILAYMEAVKAEENAEVRGIIVASGFPERVKLAAKQISNLKLLEYSFQFNYHPIK